MYFKSFFSQLVLSFIAFGIFFAGSPICAGSGTSAIEHSTYYDDGHIVMTDNVMGVATNNTSVDVTKVEIHTLSGTLVTTIVGCNKPSCEYDLSTLESGDYNVVVTVSINDTFSDTIRI